MKGLPLTAEQKQQAFKVLLKRMGIKISGGRDSKQNADFRKEPPTSDLIEVPSIEDTPIDDYIDGPQDEVTPSDYVRAEILTILQQRPERKPRANCSPPPSLVDIPDEFSTPEDFVRFRQEYDAVLRKRSDDLGMTEKIHICNVPTCVSPTVPLFDYCLFHLPKDKRYLEQYLVRTCTEKDPDGRQCATPTTIGLEKCTRHLRKNYKA